MSERPWIHCGRGHYYDPAIHSSCPHCGVPLDIEQTRPSPDLKGQEWAGEAPGGGAKTVKMGDPPPPRQQPTPDEGVTRRYPMGKGDMNRMDPVVGWLVCVAGPDKGRDYRIHAERNFIGRGADMDIAVAGDEQISRKNHAVISYNPKRHTFTIAPGDSHGLTYLNDDELLTPQPLSPYDAIELGQTKLLFVPFCGERFTWTAPAEAKG